MQLSLLELLSDTPKPDKPQGQQLTREELSPYLPKPAIDYILQWFELNNVRFRIAPARTTKFGDYRTASKSKPAIISVNCNLNKYDFLITLVHEMAHDAVMAKVSLNGSRVMFRRIQDRPKPHGMEWKSNYYSLMAPLMHKAVFPDGILYALQAYFLKAKATVKSNQNLAFALSKFDSPDGNEFLQDLPLDAIFQIPGGRSFRKQELIRKRYRCQSLDNRKMYLFSPLAKVSRG